MLGALVTTDGPQGAITDFVSIAGSANHVCAVRATGAVHCWGTDNRNGQLGNTTYDVADTAGLTPVALRAAARTVTAGSFATCAGLTDGSVWCWGNNVYGMLGRPTTSLSFTGSPVQVEGLPGAVSLGGGGVLTCALTEVGEALCWGSPSSTPMCAPLDP
jgi:alpha-tubulin suppressor-like RCC1 family protein